MLKTVDRYTTDSRPILRRQSMVNVSAECRPLYRPRYLPIVSRYVGRYLGWYIGRYVDWHISVDILTDTWPICRPTYRSTLGRYTVCRPIHWSTVGWYVDRYIGRGVHKIHMIRWIYKNTKRSFFICVSNWGKLSQVSLVIIVTLILCQKDH